jgi:lipopolysaccharide transport system ATP-binding protein
MQVRLAFSIAIRAETDVLLIDEVLAVGDQSFQEKCFAYFEDIRRTGKTVILISHDGGVIEHFCERVAIIDKGQLVDIGEARPMVYKYGAIVANEQFQEKDGQTDQKHQGTGELNITKVELLGPSGRPTRALEFGQTFKIRLHYALSKPIAGGVIVGVDLIDSQDVSVLGPNTKEAAGKLKPLLEPKGVIEAEFDSNPLAAGTYSVTAGIFNDKATFAYDLVEHAIEFKIIGEPRHGKIYIEPRWSFTKDTK